MRQQRQPMAYPAILAAVSLLCCILALLQFRWTGELARADRERIRSTIQSALGMLGRDFNSEVADAVSALLPTMEETEILGKEQAYAARYREWRQDGPSGLFVRIAIAIPVGREIGLQLLEREGGVFHPASWPADWEAMRRQLESRVRGDRLPPIPMNPFLFELPRFNVAPGSPGGPRRGPEEDWMILELSESYIRDSLMPRLVGKHLKALGNVALDVEVLSRGNGAVLYQTGGSSSARIGNMADASIALFDPFQPGRPRMQAPNNPPGPPPDGGRGRWQMLVRSRNGSLDALVQRARWRNLAISGGILALLLVSVLVLFRLSRRAQQLADLQMRFVAGVSHELRTPLTVIRTASFNLREKVFDNPERVKRYGTLVEQEAQKLDLLIQQVLQFANTRSGRVIGPRLPVRIDTVIEEGIESSHPLLTAKGCLVEKTIAPKLPLVMADEPALRQVVQNLLENAAKYGADGSGWIGVAAESLIDGGGCYVQIRVRDRGPGIPVAEQPQIFDAFFRGERAVQDQIHGTGLGLNLAKQIVEAHDGSIAVNSQTGSGAEFIVKLPALTAGESA